MKAQEKRKILVERIPGPFASLYEKATRMVIETYYVPISEEVVANLKAGHILDLGTGPGYLPIEIVKRSPQIRVHGVDLSRKLIEMARSNASKAGVAEQLHFEAGNASRLRFGDETFDMVLSTGMLHTLKDPVKVLKECNRVLKRGGTAWIYDPARVCSQIDIRRWRASFTLWERFMYMLLRPFAKISPGRTYEREQVAAMIEAAHFRKYEIKEHASEMRIRLTK
ncbi:MAG: class I SAM-dependent methyltransferase [Thermodesulfobacteriota bacterium]